VAVIRPRALAAVLLAALAIVGTTAALAARVGDLTRRPGDVPRRLVGYGLVVGLDGSGDRSFAVAGGNTPTVRSVVNVLRRFGIEVPSERLRARNVAAVLVTAEVSPWLRAGGRFDVQVSALGDATSLDGGTLWMTPLQPGPEAEPVASAQGVLEMPRDGASRGRWGSQSNRGRVADGGILETDPAASAAPEPRLFLRQPDPRIADRIARAIDAAFGAGTARVEDPGAIALNPARADSSALGAWLAAVDTVGVAIEAPVRVVLSKRDGTVVAGGDLRVGPAVVSHRGITLRIGGAGGRGSEGLVDVAADAPVRDVVAGLHAAGASADDLIAVLGALQAAGALAAEVVVR
jgi:flagellar P-ring protein precursor FlgI